MRGVEKILQRGRTLGEVAVSAVIVYEKYAVIRSRSGLCLCVHIVCVVLYFKVY